MTFGEIYRSDSLVHCGFSDYIKIPRIAIDHHLGSVEASARYS